MVKDSFSGAKKIKDGEIILSKGNINNKTSFKGWRSAIWYSGIIFNRPLGQGINKLNIYHMAIRD